MQDTCSVYKVQERIARQSYEECIPASQRSAERLQTAQDRIDKYNTEAEQLLFMNAFLLQTLEKEAGNMSTLNDLGGIVKGTISDLQAEIDNLKSQIRTARRRFMDSGPQVSPAVGGLYFTRVPDNQVLIGLLSTLGVLLIAVSACILLGFSPIGYMERTSITERLITVASIWVGTLLLTYMALFIFT